MGHVGACGGGAGGFQSGIREFCSFRSYLGAVEHGRPSKRPPFRKTLTDKASCRSQRPFVNYYGPTFILYELSSPFLNFHWFFDKVNLTGSRAQLYNGILLLLTFFSCRLVWGTYQSLRVYQDVWAALHYTPGGGLVATDPSFGIGTSATEKSGDANAEMMRFAGERVVPLWLACTYLGSNVVLNTLNFYWFGKMIEAVKKRFQPQKERRGSKGDVGRGPAVGVGSGNENGRVGAAAADAGARWVRSEMVDGTGKSRVVLEKKVVRRRKG